MNKGRPCDDANYIVVAALYCTRLTGSVTTRWWQYISERSWKFN